MEGFSLDDLALEDEASMEIKSPSGQPTGWIWTFAGPGHPRTVAVDEKGAKRHLSITDEQEKARVNMRKWKGTGDTLDDVRERGVDYIIARLLRWSDIPTSKSDPTPFPLTPENARKLLMNPGMTIWEQANTFLIDEKSFTPRSATS